MSHGTHMNESWHRTPADWATLYSQMELCVTWLTHMCHTTHSYVLHDSLICVTWLIRMWYMTDSYVLHDTLICVYKSHELFHRTMADWATSHCHMSICVTWLTCMCHMTHSYASHDSCVLHDSFVCVYVSNDSFLRTMADWATSHCHMIICVT